MVEPHGELPGIRLDHPSGGSLRDPPGDSDRCCGATGIEQSGIMLGVAVVARVRLVRRRPLGRTCRGTAAAFAIGRRPRSEPESTHNSLKSILDSKETMQNLRNRYRIDPQSIQEHAKSSREIPQGISQGIRQETLPPGIPRGIPQGIPHGIPQGISPG